MYFIIDNDLLKKIESSKIYIQKMIFIASLVLLLKNILCDKKWCLWTGSQNTVKGLTPAVSLPFLPFTVFVKHIYKHFCLNTNRKGKVCAPLLENFLKSFILIGIFESNTMITSPRVFIWWENVQRIGSCKYIYI